MSEIKVIYNPNTEERRLFVETTLVPYFKERFDEEVLVKVVQDITTAVAEKIVAEKFGEILAKVDTQAIANLAVARCAYSIAEELGKKRGEV